MRIAVTMAAVAAAAACLTAVAQTTPKKVYRCEVNGKVTYTDETCKGGAELAADDARSESQRKAARDAVAREGKLAQQMTRERQAAEAAAAKQGAAHIGHSAADAAASAVPSTDKKMKKLKKAAKAPAKPPAAQP